MIRKIVASSRAIRIAPPVSARVLASSAIGNTIMSITNISGRANEVVSFAFQVGSWVAACDDPTFVFEMRDPVTRAMRWEGRTGVGPSAALWLELASDPDTPAPLIPAWVCGGTIPLDVVQSLGAVRSVYELRVEDPTSNTYRVISSGIVNLT